MTIYLFGLLQGRFTMQHTDGYILNHWADWFSQLPSYQAVNDRLNQMGWHVEIIVDNLAGRLQHWPALRDVRLTDALPIILSKRPDSAYVAPQLADKGYCSKKKLYYHGLKFHLVGVDRLATTPLPERMQFRPASANDLTVLRQQLPYQAGGCLVGDKVYSSAPLRKELLAHQQLDLFTPVKRNKGQKRLDSTQKLFSTYVSRMPQPIEYFFNWLNEHTQIQYASKVHSQKSGGSPLLWTFSA